MSSPSASIFASTLVPVLFYFVSILYLMIHISGADYYYNLSGGNYFISTTAIKCFWYLVWFGLVVGV